MLYMTSSFITLHLPRAYDYKQKKQPNPLSFSLSSRALDYKLGRIACAYFHTTHLLFVHWTISA